MITFLVVDNRKEIAANIRSRLIAKKDASLRKAEEDKAEVLSLSLSFTAI